MQKIANTALEERLLDLLTSVQAGSLSPTEAMLVIRGEVIANFYRGFTAAKSAPVKGRSFNN